MLQASAQAVDFKVGRHFGERILSTKSIEAAILLRTDNSLLSAPELASGYDLRLKPERQLGLA